VIKIWIIDVHVGCNGVKKPMNMIDFLTLVSIIIEENNKLIKEQGPYEKNLDLDFQFSISIPIQFDFSPCLIISCAYFLYKYVRMLGLCL